MSIYKKIFALFLFATLSSCVATYDVIQQGETLVLTDQTRIPCRILDFDGVDIYFKARRSADAYSYGDFMAIGNVEAIHFSKGGQTLSYSPLEYLDKKFPVEQDQETTPESAYVVEENPETTVDEPAPEVSKAPQIQLNTEGFMSDSLARARAAQGIGLNLTERMKPEQSESPIAYNEIAELIVESGGTGLVLYRVERNIKNGFELTEAQQTLVDAINEADSWDERKKSLRGAHKIASEAFVTVDANDLEREFRFRAEDDRDALIQFLIYLHKQGDLYDRDQFDKAVEVFGEKATRALSDILINFEDWYYIVVVKSGY
ncbi:MAG: hypothetical protein DWQ10_07610 [Calditrichaeota bacterium]|nr:MAG: hypothetical protein DWQ10_07610 [Calditrichota bacterium]